MLNKGGILDDRDYKEERKKKIEKVAREYHEICRELVNKQIGMITKPTRPYIEWDDLTDEMKEGRRFIAEKLIHKYKI